MLDGSPRRAATVSRIWVRSSVTTPLLMLTAPLPPLTIVMNSWSARRLALAHKVWINGRWSAASTAVTAPLRSAPAAGPASGCRRGGNVDFSSPATFTLAYS